MSKSIALIAFLSAGSGAAATAALFSLCSSKSSSHPSSVSTSSTPPTTASAASSPPISLPSTIATFSTSPTSPVNPAGLFDLYGFPGPAANLAHRHALISSFDRRTRNPHWVIEHITPASVAMRGGDRRHSVFLEDPSVPEKFRAHLRDYHRSGYDRGHQVPAADARWSQAAMDDTFYLTNMCPQVGDGFNRDYWAHLEDFCRRLTERYASVRIATGPLYLPRRDPADGKWYVRYEVIGEPPNVAVPTHFYKVVFAEGPQGGKEGPVALGAFVLPNAPIPNSKPLTDFEVPLEAVEKASGLEFVTKLPPERRRRLCADTNCSITVREFAARQTSVAKGA